MSVIQFDAATFSGAWNGAETSVTWSHTCSASADRTLIVYVLSQDSHSQNYSATYNGVAMTAITSIDSTTGGYQKAFYLKNPASGAHNVVVTRTAGTSGYMNTAAHSFTGTDQTTQPNASNTFTGVVSPASPSVTVTSTLCYLTCSFTAADAGEAAGANTTLRTSSVLNTFTSSTLRGTGSQSLNFTWSYGGVGREGGGLIIAVQSNPSPSPIYWVGGTGNVSDVTHWSETSGGSGSGGFPGASIDLVYDSNSGTGTSTVDASTSIGSLTMTGYTGTLAGSSALNVGGSLSLGSGMTNSYTGAITFSSTTTGKTITTAGKSLASALTFDGVGGGWTLQDALTNTGSITLTNGSLSTGDNNVSIPSLSSSNSNTRSLTLGSNTVTLTGSGTPWNISTATSMTFTSGTSTIKLTDATSSSKTFAGGGLTYSNLWITGSGTGTYTITGSNTFSDFKVDTPPHTVLFTAGTTQTLNTFTVNGTAGNLMTLKSTSDGSSWYMHKSTPGTITCDYLSLQDSHVS